jgi:hypothetical protein
MSKNLSCVQGHQWELAAAPASRHLACPTCGAAPSLESLGAPAAVAAAVYRLRDELQQAAAANLAGLILFGGLARGRFRPGHSDVNLVVLLRDASASALSAIAPALRRAWRAAGVEPFLLTPQEVRLAADVFATKFLDIQDNHIVLAGENPFAGLEVSREHLRLRIEQELRNTLLRLRRRFVGVAEDPAALTAVLAEVARPLALQLLSLLHLAGKAIPAEDRSAAIFEAAAGAFDLDRPALTQLAALRQDLNAAADPRSLCEGIFASIGRVIDAAVRLKEASS